MELRISVILGLMVGCILLASMLPTALNALYSENSDYFAHAAWETTDASGSAIAHNTNESDTATAAIWNLLPLMGVLAGMGVLVAVGIKEFT